ncbi:hypothetical protein KC722_02265 [Candidatus Kaiserbacteria bacterium]|nr:hypothetical protein [Candidatus Kaiserbacteria bacterium]MCB9811633.1 hypothetical protein [Candidatus Nomurabacteria bacterium]
MTNVSKRKLPATEFDKLYQQFGKVVADLNVNSAVHFFDDLLGPEEKIMLIKRLAAITMFIEGNSSYRVWQLLQLSPSTAEKIRLDYECGRYKHIETILKQNKSDYRKFWEVLEIILQAGMPPRGRGRWKSVLQRVE